MILDPTDTGKVKCPVARTFHEKAHPYCEGPDCILWRWVKNNFEVKAFAAAVKTARAELQEQHPSVPISNMSAEARVKLSPAKYGLPEGPTHGYCGLGGIP